VSSVQPGLVSPVFVGRGEELAALLTALGSASAGEPAVVVVGGEAGVGKTRLVEEAATRAREADTRVLSGACIELGGRGLALSPVVDGLRSLTHFMDRRELDEVLGPASGELARLLPELDPGHALALAPAGEDGNLRLLELVFGVIQRLAADRPLMVVMEDLHWADQSTLDLASLLVRALRAVRVALVMTFRSDELHRSHPLRPLINDWERVRSVRRLELPRFSREEAAGQLEAILGEPAEQALVDTVYARSEGNAFLGEEVLAALQAGSAADALPTTLRDVLLARAERLSPATVGLLRIASAAGTSVPDRLLSAVAQVDDAELDAGLREAVEHHLLVVDEERQGYRFRHALTRDAIYSDMLPRERVRIHAAYARVLSDDPALAGADASVAAALARHWTAAHDIPLALGARIAAARQAAAYAPAEALAHFEHALELWPNVADAEERCGMDVAEALRLAASSASAAGELDRSLALYDEALAELDPSATERIALILAAKAVALEDLGRLEEAGSILERAASLLPAEPPTVARAAVLGSLAGSRMMVHVSAESGAAAERALAAAVAAGAREHEATARILLGTAWAFRGDNEAALGELRRGLALAEELSEYALSLRAYLNLSDALHALGDYEECVAVARQGLEVAVRVGLTRHVYGIYLAGNLAETLTLLGQWAEAEALLSGQLQSGASNLFVMGALAMMRARLAVLAGRIDAAQADLDAARAALFSVQEFQFALPFAHLSAMVAFARGDVAQAREDVRTALEGHDDASERYAWPLVWFGLRIEAETPASDSEAVAALAAIGADLPSRTPAARAYQALAHAERARVAGTTADWPGAVAAARASRDQYLVAYALLRQAQDAYGQGDRDAAAPALEEAAGIAAETGAAPLLDEARALARRARLRLPGPGPDSATAEPAGVDSLGLTERELEVLSLLAAGRSNPQIADELFISPKTASVHVSNIIGKLNVSSRGEAAAVAHRLGVEPAAERASKAS